MQLTKTVLPVVLGALLLTSDARAQQVVREEIPGIRNFARVETTVACGGTIAADAMPELTKRGFKSIINLRLPTEPGADVADEAAAAEAASLHYVHIPFNTREPDPAAVERFLEAIVSPDVSPAYIHCGGGPRAAAMWLIKRLVVDEWETDRAVAEATALGLTVDRLKAFALEYAATHRR